MCLFELQYCSLTHVPCKRQTPEITVHIHPSSGRVLLTAGATVVSEQPALTELLVGHQNVSQQALSESWQSVGYHVVGLVRPVLKVSAAGEQRGRQEQKPVQGR